MAATDVETAPGAQPTPKKKGGRPKLGSTVNATPASLTFFERLSRIAPADWGPRANIHLYRLEPYTDRLRSGTVIFILKYAEPITEERILIDHGSGRYRAILTFRKPAAEKGDELDKLEFDLLNQNYPPKIPPGEWVDDPRNKKWAWARPKTEEEIAASQPQQTPLSVFTESMKAVSEIRKSAIEEQGGTNKQPTLLEMLSAVKSLTAPNTSTDNELLKTVLALTTAQVQASQAETAALRTQLLEVLKGRGAEDPMKQFTSTVEQFKQLKDILNPEKEESLIESVAGAMKNGRGARTTWLDIGMATFPKIAEALTPIANALAMRMMQPQPAPNGTVHTPAPQQPAAAASQLPPHIQAVLPLVEKITPTMLAKLNLPAEGAELGEEFAGWVFEGHGVENLKQLQSIGADTIVTMYKGSPVWVAIQSEHKFRAFIEAFCKWTPEEEEEEPEFQGVSGSTEIDLEAV